MQTPSTSTGQRDPLTRTRKPLSPINAAQRAGYGLDTTQTTVTAQPTAQTASARGPASAAAKAH